MDPSSSSQSNQSIVTFSIIVLSSVAWIILIKVFLPRLLGLLLSFCANRFLADVNIRISSLYIYPLAGRALIQTIKCTHPNYVVDIEQLVLRFRWWRRVQKLPLRQLLNVDHPQNLDPVAAEQARIQTENNAFFLKRQWFRLKRWHRRNAVVSDPNDAIEPPALISLTTSGFRLRVINAKRRYDHVAQVIALAKKAARSQKSASPQESTFDLRAFSNNQLSTDLLNNIDDNIPDNTSSTSNSSTSSVNEKPVLQEILGHSSLRVIDGSFYFCDMAQSPLVRVTVDSVKLRYRYGAPACQADEHRKRFRMRISNLKVSVADQKSVRKVIEDPLEKQTNPKKKPRSSNYSSSPAKLQNNTNKLIRRIVTMGHLGFDNSKIYQSRSKLSSGGSDKRKNRLLDPKINISGWTRRRDETKRDFRHIRKPQQIKYSDILKSCTTIVDYVFDEPGLNIDERKKTRRRRRDRNRSSTDIEIEDDSQLPAPVSKVSILLREAGFTYDVPAFADLETVIERLEPALYDLLPLSRRLISDEGRRAATGMQIEVEATPIPMPNDDNSESRKFHPLLRIPFFPRLTTWKTLQALNVRKWKDSTSLQHNVDVDGISKGLPLSFLSVHTRKLTFKTEVPHNSGAPQRISISLSKVKCDCEGVVNMPLGNAKTVNLTRDVFHPQQWNGLRNVKNEVTVSETEFFYLPDTIRILNDIVGTMEEFSKKAPSVNYFIPFKETLRIEAVDKYRVIVSCSHENSWSDISNRQADEYGHIVVSGDRGSISFVPNLPMGFYSDTVITSWTLTLPNANGKLVLPIPSPKEDKNREESEIQNPTAQAAAKGSSYKGMSTYLTKRARSQLQPVSDNPETRSSNDSGWDQQIEIDFLKIGELFEMSGKILFNENRMYLDTKEPAFLDSVNRGDVSLKISALTLDINPHHITNILNMTRVYAGQGMHTLTVNEKERLKSRRKEIAREMLASGRYPTANECNILGLGAGPALLASREKRVIDDVLCLTFQIDSVLIRTHDLPHSLTAFDFTSQDIFSAQCQMLQGKLSANRLGLDLSCSPDPSNNVIILYEGALPRRHTQNSATEAFNFLTRNKEVPCTRIDNFYISKTSLANPEWGAYHSQLKVTADKVTGSVLDTMIACIARIGPKFIPDLLFDDQVAPSTLLTVDNIEVRLNHADVLVLSPSSTSTNDVLERRNNLRMPSSERLESIGALRARIPKFLSGVSQIVLPSGMRVCMSNLAQEKTGTQTRICFPNMTISVLTNSSGKVTSWVDLPTTHAHVAHVLTRKRGVLTNSVIDNEAFRQAIEVSGLTFDISFNYKPQIWSPKVRQLQSSHVSNLSLKTRFESFPWCYPRGIGGYTRSEGVDDIRTQGDQWWIFLSNTQRASIMTRHLQRKDFSEIRFDSMSVSVTSKPTIIVAPEFLDLAWDMAERGKKYESEVKQAIRQQQPAVIDDLDYPSFSGPLLAMWRMFESHSSGKNIFHNTNPSKESLRAFQTSALSMVLLHPVVPVESSEDPLYSPRRMPLENITIIVPYGLHLLQTERILSGDGLQSRSNQPQNRRTKVLHISMPSLQVVCGSLCLARMSNTVFIQRETEKRVAQKHELKGKSETKEDVNVTAFARIGSIKIGQDNSSLFTYECFFKVIAVTMLILRTVSIQLRTIQTTRSENIEFVCRKLFGASPKTLLTNDEENVRALLVAAASPTSISRSHKPDMDLSSEVLDLTKIPLKRKKRELQEDKKTYFVDFRLQDVSLKILEEEILTIDFLACNGGSTEKEKNLGGLLDGMVLNAVSGTVSLFIRDDIIASSLDTVSSVASYVRKATLTAPILREEGNNAKGEVPVGSNLLAFRYGDEKLMEDSLMRSPSSRDRASRRKRRQIGSSRFPSGSRSKSHNRESSTRKWNQFYDPRPPVSPGDYGKSILSLPTWAQNFQLRSPKIFQREPIENSGFPRTEYPPLELLPSPAVSPRSETPVMRMTQAQQASTESRRIETEYDDDDVVEEERPLNDGSYVYVAVRTAGDSGPPRKRSKSMRRISPVVPPDFQQQDSAAGNEESRNVIRKLFESEDRTTSEDFGKYTDRERSASRHVTGDPRRGDGADQSSRRRSSSVKTNKPKFPTKRVPISLFVSFQKLVCQYHRGSLFSSTRRISAPHEADILFVINDPRVTMMSAPEKSSYSMVFTTSSAELTSSKDPECVLHGSIQKIGLTISIAPGYQSSTLPKLIASLRLTEFKSTLHAKDLQAVLRFREEFKKDLKGMLSAFVKSQHSITEMKRATSLSSAPIINPSRTLLTTMSFDLLCDNSRIALTGFHPRDSEMSVYYSIQALYFSIVASESESAALTLGLRLYGHGLSLSSPLWVSEEKLHFPSIDAKGVQWGETVGLPTILKVSAGPLVNSTSIQGLRHILFTVSGLLAFQNVETDQTDEYNLEQNSEESPKLISTGLRKAEVLDEGPGGGTPFSRTVVAWERTKGARMDISIRPMSLSLASGEVAALFEVGKITGTLEWNKLVKSGVQLQAAVCLPSISLTCLKMPSSNFKISEVTPERRNASLSVKLDRPRIDILKAQEDLKHTFTFRATVFKVIGQVRPWRLLLDAACWADSQEVVSELQSINYRALSTTNKRQVKPAPSAVAKGNIQHREILFGMNVKGFSLVVPLLHREISSPRLTFSGTEVHLYGRQSHSPIHPPSRNLLQLSIDFVGVFWEKSTVLSSRFAKVTLGIEHPSTIRSTYFGGLSVIIVPGTWNIRPNGDIVHAIINAKHSDENKEDVSRARHLREMAPESRSFGLHSSGDLSLNNDTSNRMLVESLKFKVLRTSGLIEVVETEERNHGKQPDANVNVPAFSVSILRHPEFDFDLMDIDFSGGEGHFPKECLRRMANLFSEVFGAVAADEAFGEKQSQREMSRNATLIVRFGNSLYRAQERMNSAIESEFGFLAGQSSALFASVSISPIVSHSKGHTTVISGISPKLGLEITPILSGASVQSLRLVDVRFVHGTAKNMAPHTITHVGKVTAVMDAKTILLIENKQRMGSITQEKNINDMKRDFKPSTVNTENNIIIMFGTPPKRITSPNRNTSSKVETDIRLQLKLGFQEETIQNQIDLRVGRIYMGCNKTLPNITNVLMSTNLHMGINNLILRAQWNDIGCKLRLKENLVSYETASAPSMLTENTSFANITNWLQAETTLHTKSTFQIEVDAFAALWGVPECELRIESTTIFTEIFHLTLRVQSKLMDQIRKLKNEVKRLSQPEITRESRRKASPYSLSLENRAFDTIVPVAISMNSISNDTTNRTTENIHKSTSNLPYVQITNGITPFIKTIVSIKGGSLTVALRGYQRHEATEKAIIRLDQYELYYTNSTTGSRNLFTRRLNTNFGQLELAYNDGERNMNNDLFRIPSPELCLMIIEKPESISASLSGDLEIKLGVGCFLWSKFQKVSNLTVQGVRGGQKQTTSSTSDSNSDDFIPNWGSGRTAHVEVDVNPRVDLIGDLTLDMLTEYVNRMPYFMYTGLVIPLEKGCKSLYQPLLTKTRDE